MGAASSTSPEAINANYEVHCRAAVVDELLDILPVVTSLRLAVEAAPPFGLGGRVRRARHEIGEDYLSAAAFLLRLYYAFRFETFAEIEDVVVSVFSDLKRSLSPACIAEVKAALPLGVRELWDSSHVVPDCSQRNGAH